MDTSISRRAEAASSIPMGRPVLRRVALGAIALMLLAVTALILSRSSLMHVRRIEVSGETHLSVAEVISASGMNAQTNALWLDTRRAEAALQRDPWIASASVKRVLPWTVRVSVVERYPVASTLTSGGFELVASDGTILGTTPVDPGLPRILWTAMVKDQGAPLSATSAALVIRALDADLRSKVKDVGVDASGAVELHLEGGLEVDVGEPVDMAAKVDALSATLKWAKEQHAHLRVIDVSAPLAPTVRLVG